MSHLIEYKGFFEKLNIVVCHHSETKDFIKYVNMKYEGKTPIIYKLHTNIKNNDFVFIDNKKNLKYKNTIIFTHITNLKSFPFQTIGKFKTPIFLFVNNTSVNHAKDSINMIKNKLGNIFVSPQLLDKAQTEDNFCDSIGFEKNTINELINKNHWGFYHTKLNKNYFIDIKTVNYTIHIKDNKFNKYKVYKIGLDFKEITEDEITEYIIENPITYENQHETSVFF
jgi:hypothetical protein